VLDRIQAPGLDAVEKRRPLESENAASLGYREKRLKFVIVLHGHFPVFERFGCLKKAPHAQEPPRQAQPKQDREERLAPNCL
jgi:hypothetical protein